MVYEHGDDGCAISGGAVADTGVLRGRYVFADYCSDKVLSILSILSTDPNPSKELLNDGVESPVVRVGGEILMLSLNGVVWRIAQ